MKLEPLGVHAHHIHVGHPLPFAIVDASGRLLLARGHVIPDGDQLENLLDRGAFIDSGAMEDVSAKIAKARPEELPGFWRSSLDDMARLLRTSTANIDFIEALDRASAPLLALIKRDPDLAILHVVRHDDHGQQGHYASQHATHAATAGLLAAQRLGWGEDARRCVLRVALTMNVSMAELQNRLVNQVTPVTQLQRAEIRSHPERSAQLLEMSGVTDRDWIEAVRQHHELPGGSGYPQGLTDIGEIALLVQRADVFTAKFRARVTRPAISADTAARAQFQKDKGDSISAALIKEFGLYPPGCVVRLKSGETGVAMRRGESANAPIVTVVVDRRGDALMSPVRRDTAQPEHSIVSVLPLTALKVRMGLDTLVACAAA